MNEDIGSYIYRKFPGKKIAEVATSTANRIRHG